MECGISSPKKDSTKKLTVIATAGCPLWAHSSRPPDGAATRAALAAGTDLQALRE
jgi:hypothetical protein